MPLKITTIAINDKFDSLKNVSQEKHNVECNPMAADKHVAEAEHMICVVKERIKASCGGMPWKEAAPNLIVCEAVKNSVTMTNVFPPKSRIHDCLSPRDIVTGKTPDCNVHFKSPSGECMQAHQNK